MRITMSKKKKTFTELLGSAWGFNTKEAESAEKEYQEQLKKIKLNKCPVCGGEAKVHSYTKIIECGYTGGYTLYNVYCDNCGIVLLQSYPNELEAIKAWNELWKKKI